MEHIRVVLVEDNLCYLKEVQALLAEEARIEVVGAYTTGRAALAGIVSTQPEVALIDLRLPGAMSGLEVIRCVAEQGSPTECLVLTVYDDDAHLFAALQAGAVGYIVKSDAPLAAIVQAIRDVVDGEAPMSMGLARRLLEALRKPLGTPESPPIQGLTSREGEVLELLAKGLTTRKVAETLHISYATVRCHQKNLYRKLQVHSLVEALAVFRGATNGNLS